MSSSILGGVSPSDTDIDAIFSVYDNYLSKQLFRLQRKNWFAGDKWLLALVLHLIGW